MTQTTEEIRRVAALMKSRTADPGDCCGRLKTMTADLSDAADSMIEMADAIDKLNTSIRLYTTMYR